METTTSGSKRRTTAMVAHERVLKVVAVACRCWLMLAFSTGLAHSDRARPQAGEYEALMLALSPDGQLTGYYREVQGTGESKRCAFSFRGQLRATGESGIATWSNVKLPGRILFTADGVKLTIPLGQDHAGCGLVLMPQIATGLELDRTADASWTALRRIIADKASLFDAPQAPKPRRGYLVKGDVVGVIGGQDGWVKVEFPANGKRTSGWIQPGSSAELSPPGGNP